MVYGYWYEVLSDDAATLPEADPQALEKLCDAVIHDALPYPGGAQAKRQEMVQSLQAGDIVVVPTLSRFAQDMDDLLRVMRQLLDRRVSFSAMDLPDIGCYNGGIFPEVLGAVALFQRDIRRAQARREARSVMLRGRNGGRPNKNSEAVAKALRLYDRNKLSIQEITERTGVSKTTLYKYLAKRRSEVSSGVCAEDGADG